MYTVTTGSIEKMKSEIVCDVLKRKQTGHSLKKYYQYGRLYFLNT